MAGLLGLRGLVKKYEYEMEEERLPLGEIVGGTFEILGALINQVLAIETEAAYDVLYLITKIFYIANQLIISPYFTEGGEAGLDRLSPWIALFKNLMDRAVPGELAAATEDMEEVERRDKHVVWKVKGVAHQLTYRLFSKYGNAKHVAKELKPFAKAFNHRFVLTLLESHLQQVLKRQSHFVGSKALNFAIKFIS
jgi:hypothetical protein